MTRMIVGVVIPVLLGLLATGIVLGLVVPIAGPRVGPFGAAATAVLLVLVALFVWHSVARRSKGRSLRP